MFARISGIVHGKCVCSWQQYGEFQIQIYCERLSCIQAHIGSWKREVLQCRREWSNLHDSYAVAVVKDDAIVGHVPRKLSTLCSNSMFLRSGSIKCRVTGNKRYSNDLPQGDLEIPCTLVFRSDSLKIEKVKRLIKEVMHESDVKEEDQRNDEDEQHTMWVKRVKTNEGRQMGAYRQYYFIHGSYRDCDERITTRWFAYEYFSEASQRSVSYCDGSWFNIRPFHTWCAFKADSMHITDNANWLCIQFALSRFTL